MRVQSVELRRPPMAAQSIVDAAVCSEINIDLWLLPRDGAPLLLQAAELRRPPMAAQSIVDAAVCSEINIDLWLLPRDGAPLLLQAAAPLDARPENDSGRSRSTWGAWMQLPLIP
eukprot:s5557_g2.t1